MKNRHRVSQVVSKLICSTGGQRKLLKRRGLQLIWASSRGCCESGPRRIAANIAKFDRPQALIGVP